MFYCIAAYAPSIWSIDVIEMRPFAIRFLDYRKNGAIIVKQIDTRLLARFIGTVFLPDLWADLCSYLVDR